MIKKRLTPPSDDDSDADEAERAAVVKSRKTRNVLLKVLNRSSTGFFAGSCASRSNSGAKFSHDSIMKICLKDIVPFRFLNDHIFMGLTNCGNFLVSYTRRLCEVDNFDINSGFMYELYFWIFRPHYPLSRHFIVNLFDDHGAADIKFLTMTQWTHDCNTIVIHGSSEIDDHHSFVSIVRVPKVNCVGCRQLNMENDTMFKNNDDLCMSCNLTVHTKYRFSESTQSFEPTVHLSVPGYVIMCENSLIHTLNVKLDMQKTTNEGGNVINYKYLRWLNPPEAAVGETKRDEEKAGDMSAKNEKSIVEQILDDFSEYDSENHRVAGAAAEISSQLVPQQASSSQHESSSTVASTSLHQSSHSSSSSRFISKPHSPNSPEQLEKAAKTYEFSEENEKCEKLSTFRKRRLADKKYEFNENVENIIPFNRTRSRTVRRTIYQNRTSPHPSFRSPCSSPIANLMSPPGFRSPSYYAYRSSPTHHMLNSPPARYMRFNEGFMSPSEDQHKYFSDIMNRMRENRCESGNESSHEEMKSAEQPTFSKKIVNYYVEEDDANSVVTRCDEDDCISPGYHLSLPMEVHGACYSKLQMVKKASLTRLKCVPKAIITQNSFDVETFAIHIANKLCIKNSKKYGILYDLAFEIVHVCPLSQKLLSVLILQFTASNRDKLSKCYTCSIGSSECYTHRKLFETTVLFSWCISGSECEVLDFGQMKQLRLTHPMHLNRQEMLMKRLQRSNKKIFAKIRQMNQSADHLRILESNEDRSKETLVDLHNGIEFYRRQPFESPSSVSSVSSNSSASGESSESDIESGDELMMQP